MSQYTTGELAKLCDVTVRTVQFYDTRDLLHPSELTEGGRRLYSERDLGTMRLICALKSYGLSLDSIKSILESSEPSGILLMLLDEQLVQLDNELRTLSRRRESVEAVRRDIKSGAIATVQSVCDMENHMNGKKQLHNIHVTMLSVGILMDLAQLAVILLWVFRGVWWPFAVVMPLVILGAALLVRMYYRGVAYVCSKCGVKFKPSMKEFFFSNHTPKTRKLTCTACGETCWCLETYADSKPAAQA